MTASRPTPRSSGSRAAGAQLRLRDHGAPARRSGGRSPRSTRSRGAWTTSPTASCRPWRSAQGSRSSARRSTRPPGDDAMLVALADARARYPIPGRRCTRSSTAGSRTPSSALRDFDDAARLLPEGRGRGRRRVHRRLRLGRGRARGDPRHRAAADQHHPRRARGLGARPRLPAAGRARVVRRRPRTDIAAGRVTPAWRALMAFQAARARAYLEDGLALLPSLDRRSAACVGDVRGPLPRDARPDRGARLRRLRRPAAALAADEARASSERGCSGEGRGRRRRPRRARRRARARRRRPRGDAARGAADARRGGADAAGARGRPEPPPDNGQHIALGCFTEYLRFLERIGSAAACGGSASSCR